MTKTVLTMMMTKTVLTMMMTKKVTVMTMMMLKNDSDDNDDAKKMLAMIKSVHTASVHLTGGSSPPLSFNWLQLSPIPLQAFGDYHHYHHHHHHHYLHHQQL